MSAKETVLAYVKAVNASPTESRALLADNFKYKGPTFSADTADEFMAMLGESAMEAELTTDVVIAEGNTVAHIGVLTLRAPVELVIRTCEIFVVENGLITFSELFFDTAKMSAGPGK